MTDTTAGEGVQAMARTLYKADEDHGPVRMNLNFEQLRWHDRLRYEQMARTVIAAGGLAAQRAQGEAHKVTWVNDASNVNDRRMYVDGQQWAKVYGWDEASLNARCDALAAAMTRPLAAQPSSVAQGEAVGVDRDWMIKVIRERSLPQDAADMIIGAMRFAATPAQPDTGDVAALREALKWLEWARPKAVSAIEDHRCLRVKSGHDMMGTYRSGTTYVGLYQSEVDEIEESADFIVALRNRLAALSKPNAPGAR